MRKFLGALAALAVAVCTVPALAGDRTHDRRSDVKLEQLKYFVDVHDRQTRTFPERISKDEFAKFAGAFEEACRAEGVILLRVHTNLETGKAYCLTAAQSADAVKRAHDRVGLPYDGITQVQTVTPGDLFP